MMDERKEGNKEEIKKESYWINALINECSNKSYSILISIF